MKKRFNGFLITTMLVAGLISGQRVNAATHTWLGAGGGNWSAAGSWSGGVPSAGEAAPVVLVFPPAGSKFTTNDIANLTVDQIQVTGDNYWITATGNATNVTLRSQLLSQTFFLSGANAIVTNFMFNIATNFTPTASISVGTGDTATFRSRFTGNGGLTKFANGTVKLQGGLPNTYLGDTFVNGGVLELSHSSNAIPGNLYIGNPSLSSTGTVSLLFQHQIADPAAVMVYQNGVLDIGVFSETLSSLTISNVAQVGGPSLIVTNVLTSYGQSTLSGIFQLAGALRTINVAEGQLTVTGFIENNTGTAGFKKIGAGKLKLNQDNGYNGTTLVNDGTLVVAHAGALGNSAFQTQVNPGGSVELAAGISLTTEALTLYGSGYGGSGALILHANSVWNGDIELQSPVVVNVPDTNAVGIIGSTIGGSGSLTKIGVGTLRLAGLSANTFTGGLTANEGTVQLAKPNNVFALNGPLWVGVASEDWDSVKVVLWGDYQIPSTVPVTVDASGWLDLNNYFQNVGPLQMRQGHISTGTGKLTVLDYLHSEYADGFIFGVSTIDGVLGLGAPLLDIYTDAGLWIDALVTQSGFTTGFRKTGWNTLGLTNPNNNYNGLTQISEGGLTLNNGAVPGSTVGGTIVDGNAAIAIYGTQVGNESLTVTSTNSYGAIAYAATNTWAGPVSLNVNTTVFSYDSPARITFSGPIAGSGALKLGINGTVIFAGTDDNLFAGPLMVDKGVLELNKSAGATAFSCPLFIGNATNVSQSAVVRLKASNQIPNNTIITIYESGLLDIGAFNDTIGGLVMRGGYISGGSGLLTLNGNVTGKASLGFAGINARVSLGGITRSLDLEQDAYLTFNNDIMDGGGSAGLTKTGLGGLYVYAPTTYSGVTTIMEGYADLGSSGCFGNTTSGTIVHSNATLSLNGVTILNEALTLYGGTNAYHYGLYAGGGGLSDSNYWNGPITLIGEVGLRSYNSCTLNLGGAVSGSGGLRINSEGSVFLSGTLPNTFTGDTRVLQGSLYLQKTNTVAIGGDLIVADTYCYVGLRQPEQIGDLAKVAVNGGGRFDLAGFAESIGSLEGGPNYFDSTPTVDHATNTFRVGGNNQSTVFEGEIRGGGGGTNLLKTGIGELKLTYDSPYSGKTTVQGGRLLLTGSLSNSAVAVYNGATFAGNGTIGSLTSSGGKIAPTGNGGSQYGKLRSLGSINLGSASQLLMDLGGTNAGVNMDQLEMVTGALTIPGCSLVVTQNFSGAVSNKYPILTVLTGGASMGTFTGVAEGANVVSSSGRAFRVNYATGTGNNDIVLTQLEALSAANFTGIVKVANGMQLNATGAANASYVVQANTNLNTTNWIDIATISASGVGALQFVDTNVVNFPVRFYRFKAQ